MTAPAPAPMTGVSLSERLAGLPDAHAADLGVIVDRLAGAGATIARELGRAALVGRLGTTGETNVQGETVKKLDVWGNEVVVEALASSGRVTTLVSEEMEAPVRVRGAAPWVVCFDPVDGSSNLDVNGVVGTIFSIRPGEAPMQPGTEQVAAGYVMYGPATLLVLATAHGVDAFTLDPATGAYLLTHAGITIPSRGRIYSVNEGNAAKWEPNMRRYVEYVRTADLATGRPYAARYAGSLVADFHRTLLEGGIYLYPGETGRMEGKLRLQYEAAPMAFVVEHAGGRASTGRERIMTITPTTHHQRVPLLVGSPEDVALAEDFVGGRKR